MSPPSGLPTPGDLVRLIRPRQWAKGAFVVVGPAYAVAMEAPPTWLAGAQMALSVLAAAVAFGFASSACYIFNDIRDRDADRAHPRKRHRPLAAGVVSVSLAWRMALLMLAGAVAATLLILAVPLILGMEGGGGLAAGLTGAVLAIYIANTTFYSIWLKHVVVLDVLSLASGFVLRVMAGCAAAAVVPSTWLLNVVLFLAMFLAFGKRLGERRTMKEDGGGEGSAADVRPVHSAYTDDLLRMAVVVTAVATLITYAGYVQEHAAAYEWGFNLLWLTMLPAVFGLLRCIVVLERGDYDDPTELASRDRPFQASVLIFGLVTAAVVVSTHQVN